MHLALVGRWGMVRERSAGRASQAALDRILEAQKGDESEKPLSSRAAVLRAGLEELAFDNLQNKKLYLALRSYRKG